MRARAGGLTEPARPLRPTVTSWGDMSAGDTFKVTRPEDADSTFRITRIRLEHDGQSVAWIEGRSCHKDEPATRAFNLDEIVRGSAGAVSQVSTGRRDPSLLADLQSELAGSHVASRPAPEDPKELKSLKERMYTAARKCQFKIKVRVEDGMVVARVKEG